MNAPDELRTAAERLEREVTLREHITKIAALAEGSNALVNPMWLRRALAETSPDMEGHVPDIDLPDALEGRDAWERYAHRVEAERDALRDGIQALADMAESESLRTAGLARRVQLQRHSRALRGLLSPTPEGPTT